MRTLTAALVLSVSLLTLSVRLSVSVCVDGDSDTEAVLGNPMKLTCISCMKREDIKAETHVFWSYIQDGEEIPIFEYDNGPRELESPLKGRLQWRGSKDLQDLSLGITNITRNDSGTYQCVVFRLFEFDSFTPSVTITRIIKLEVKDKASLDPTALYSEIMMYVLLVFLTLWLLVEMVYCYRKISKSDEMVQDAVTDYLAVPSDKDPSGPAASE
ncbi:sodium channel regulatory subunit beta-3 [Alosa pseudoharengus]|uniref:sodium channel regulatory subunit beta-3 n=1 Tax=Alosa pseudoharengus TaxID=34774 RepID=UPI003F8AC782